MQVVEPLWGTTIAHRAIPAHCSDSGWWVVVGVRSGGRGSSSGGIGCLCKLSCLPKTMSTWVCAGALHWPWMGLWVFSFIRFRWSRLWGSLMAVSAQTGLLLPVKSGTETLLKDLASGEHSDQTGWLSTGWPALLFLSAFKSRTSTALAATASL